MDEEVPPARTRGGGRAGAALQARATWCGLGTREGPRFPPLQGCLFPQEELERLLLRMVKAVLSPGQREIPRATGNRGHTPITAADTEGDDSQPPFSHKTACAAQRQGL